MQISKLLNSLDNPSNTSVSCKNHDRWLLNLFSQHQITFQTYEYGFTMNPKIIPFPSKITLSTNCRFHRHQGSKILLPSVNQTSPTKTTFVYVGTSWLENLKKTIWILWNHTNDIELQQLDASIWPKISHSNLRISKAIASIPKRQQNK